MSTRQSPAERIVRWWASRRDGRAMRDQWAAGYRAGVAATLTDAERFGAVIHVILREAGIGVPEVADLLGVDRDESAAMLADLGYQDLGCLHVLATAAGTPLSEVARRAGL